MPDHSGRNRKGTERLQKLPQKHEQDEAEKRPNAVAEEPTTEEKNAQRVYECGSDNEQGIGGCGVLSEIRIQAGSQVVQRVSDATGSGRCSGAKQGLRPEPNRENDSGYHKPKKQSAPTPGIFAGLYVTRVDVSVIQELLRNRRRRHLQS